MHNVLMLYITAAYYMHHKKHKQRKERFTRGQNLYPRASERLDPALHSVFSQNMYVHRIQFYRWATIVAVIEFIWQFPATIVWSLFNEVNSELLEFSNEAPL